MKGGLVRGEKRGGGRRGGTGRGKGNALQTA